MARQTAHIHTINTRSCRCLRVQNFGILFIDVRLVCQTVTAHVSMQEQCLFSFPLELVTTLWLAGQLFLIRVHKIMRLALRLDKHITSSPEDIAATFPLCKRRNLVLRWLLL